MERVIDLGDLIIPLIKPQKGVDYYTASEKQEFVNIVTNNVNEVVLPQEEIRQSNEVIRQDNEATRQSQEDTRQSNETSRQTAETARASAESTRQSNETSRVSAEETRAQTFSSQMDAVDTAIAGINTSQTAFNENATSKTSDFNTNATNKTTAFNENATSKTNAFDEHTAEIQAKLATIETGAEVNVIESVKVNGTALTPTNKEVDVPVPTKISDLTNDSGFGTYTKPSGGIPKTDLSSDVQTSLNKADSALQEHQDISGKVDKEHKTGSQVEYKVLSDNNYTDAEKEKLASLENYDDTDITARVDDIEEEQETQNEDIEKLQDKVANQQKILSQMPKVIGEGTEFTMENTIEAQFAEFAVEGRSEQETTTGVQLLQLKASQDDKTTNNINQRLYVDTGKVVLNGKPSVTFNLLLAEITLQAGTYSMSGCPLGGSWADTYGLLLVAGSTSYADYGNGKTFTVEQETSFQLMMRVSSSYTFSNFTFYPQIELGSIIHPFEPYTGGIPSPNVDFPQLRYSAGANGSIIEKIVNKNFHNKTTDVSGKRLSSDGTLINDSGYATTDFIPVIPSSNIVYSRAENGGGSAAIVFYTKNKVGISRTMPIMATTATSKTIAIPENAYYIKTCDSASIMDNVQIEIGSTATPYTEHQEQTYTMPVQQEMRDIKDSSNNILAKDEFIRKQDGKLYERHNVARIIFDGTENWAVEQSAGMKRFNLTISDLYYYNERGEYAKSNYFHSTINSEYGAIITYQSRIMIYVSENITTVEQFTAWLAEKYANNTPVYVDYILEEPIDLPCTQEQITALENLPETYAGQTNVLSEDTVSANVKASGYLDLNTLITRVAQLETEV